MSGTTAEFPIKWTFALLCSVIGDKVKRHFTSHGAHLMAVLDTLIESNGKPRLNSLSIREKAAYYIRPNGKI